MSLIKTVIGRLRIVGFLEGLSFLILLFIAMPLKYMFGLPEAVRVVGMAHGLLFVLFVISTIQAAIQYRWSLKLTVIVLLASVIPFGTFYADARYLRAIA